MSRIPHVLVCVLVVLGVAHVLRSDDAKPRPPEVGIALIDVAKVFKAYPRFEQLRDQLKKEIEVSDALAREMKDEVKKLTTRRDAAKREKNSDEVDRLERKLDLTEVETQKFIRNGQREFLVKEAQIYRQVYLDVVGEVKQLARERNLRLVFRHSAEELPKENAEPSDIMASMNRLVVHEEGLDITGEIIRRLKAKEPAAETESP